MVRMVNVIVRCLCSQIVVANVESVQIVSRESSEVQFVFHRKHDDLLFNSKKMLFKQSKNNRAIAYRWRSLRSFLYRLLASLGFSGSVDTLSL